MFENHKVEKAWKESGVHKPCVSRFILLTEHVYVWVFVKTAAKMYGRNR